MKAFTFLILLTVAQLTANANAVEPIKRGTLCGSPFTSQYVDVVNERLFIKINEDFSRAEYVVEYQIHSVKEGFQIPLLFYVSELNEPIEAFVDNKKIETIVSADRYDTLNKVRFLDFTYFFKSEGTNRPVLIEESNTGGFYVEWDDMIYFETDLSRGDHVIRIHYAANRWTDGSEWVNMYSFRYALSPAKYWKSFGTLDVVVDASEFSHLISTNLHQPGNGRVDSIATWHYTKLPTEIIQVYYTPTPGPLVQQAVQLGPSGFTKGLALILIAFHVILTYFYRKKNPHRKHNLILNIGSVIVPFLIVFSWVLFYALLKFLLGDDASSTRGYYNFLFLYYPIIVPAYWTIFWIFDKMIKTRLTR